MRPHSIVTADGGEREVDTIIFGTGFHVTDFPDRRHDPRARRPHPRARRGSGSAEAYLGTTVAGFPNLFLLLGPNTALGHTSIVFMIESQINHVWGALSTMRRRGARVAEVRPEVQRSYNEELNRLTEGTVWVTGGCSSYYIDRNGHNSTLWPTFTWPFRQRTRGFDEAAYSLDTSPAKTAPETREAPPIVRGLAET